MHTCAILVAAGKSRRMGFDKLLAPIAGKSVLQRSVESLAACPAIDSLVLVCDEARFLTLDFRAISQPVFRVDGGAERHHSVWNGLQAAPAATTHFAVHDGARPLISREAIEKTIAAALAHGAAALARPATETMKRANDEGFSAERVSRENLWFMETPQIFSRDILVRAYEFVLANHLLVTDEVSAVEAIGIPSFLVANTQPNLKITHPSELILAEALLPQASAAREIP